MLILAEIHQVISHANDFNRWIFSGKYMHVISMLANILSTEFILFDTWNICTSAFFCFFAKWIYLTNLLCIQIAISRQTFGFCCGVVFVSLLFRIENACQCIWITHFLQALDVLIFFQDVTICASCGAFVRSFNAYCASVWCFINNE